MSTDAAMSPAGPAAEVSGRPEAQCDLVMKGGITSGVIYPGALAVIGRRYRIRGIGGASAGAIGAAIGAAAEFGGEEGYRKLELVPHDLGRGRLAGLFQPARSTRPLLGLMLAATGNTGSAAKRKQTDAGALEQASSPPSGRFHGISRIARGIAGGLGILARAVASFPFATVVGALPGLALLVAGFFEHGAARVVFIVVGLLLALIGGLTAIAVGIVRKLTRAVPANMFGICTGLGSSASKPGFTDWLSTQLDDLAGLPTRERPLRFGHLWTGTTTVAALPDPADRRIDLRMITTCLSEGRPYELPLSARRFFYDVDTWARLFPPEVMRALEKAPLPDPPPGEDALHWKWETDQAQAHDPKLYRLPDAQHLPVIVAVRLSLSFPLLISAVPLWTVDRRDPGTVAAYKAFHDAKTNDTSPPESGVTFHRVWFTDGGFCSNFPVHLFDAALPSRPTFAINLGRFDDDTKVDLTDETNNVEWARTNREGIASPYVEIPERGFKAIGGFGSAAINTARNWQDSAQLTQPGYRDRIVRVLQTKGEGGLNLYMDGSTINRLTARGAAAATAITDQFAEPRYPARHPTMSGWDNHRWIRYRALMASLPPWLQSYRNGRATFAFDARTPPSYRYQVKGRELSDQLANALDNLAAIADAAEKDALEDVTSAPNPVGAIRRTPRI